MLIHLSDRELATVLAALRTFHAHNMNELCERINGAKLPDNAVVLVPSGERRYPKGDELYRYQGGPIYSAVEDDDVLYVGPPEDYEILVPLADGLLRGN